MGQELVKFDGATELTKRLDQSVALTAPTSNQQRLRELLSGEATAQPSRLYHPPAVQSDFADWAYNGADEAPLSRQVAHLDYATQSADPKACWTGFTFGIVCAGAVGFAFFLSLAAVVTPQPSVAALVPFAQEDNEAEITASSYQFTQLDKVGLDKQMTADEPKSPTIWYQLRGFHASAGKFSQPGIVPAPNAEPDRVDGQGQTVHEAGLSAPSLQKSASVEALQEGEAGHNEAGQNSEHHPLRPQLINAVTESRTLGENQLASFAVHRTTIVLENADPSNRTDEVLVGIALRAKLHHAVLSQQVPDREDADYDAFADYEKTVLAPSTLTPRALPSATSSPSEPVKASRESVNVVKSSLKPTARTKISLSERRSKRIKGAKRIRNVKRASSRKSSATDDRYTEVSSVFGTYRIPLWATAEFGLLETGSN